MSITMVHRFLNDVFVLVHGRRSPFDTEWDLYLSELRQHADRLDCVKTLVMTDGGGPDGAQRQRLNNILRGRPTLAAVITSSFVARAVVGTLAAFNPRIRAFSPSDVGFALAYLHVPTDDYSVILRTSSEMRRTIAQQDDPPASDIQVESPPLR